MTKNMSEANVVKLLHDNLTGLPSRLLLRDRIELELAHARRNGTQVSLFHLDPFPMSDIDHLFGYKIGDEVLKQIAKRLVASVRESDTVVRMDADEFAVLMPTVGDDEASIVIEKVTNALEAPIEVGELCINIGVMIGVASYPTHCNNAEELIRGALKAVKQAKAEHIPVVYHDGVADRSASFHMEVFGRLRHAVRNGELTLNYQPKVDLQSGEIRSVEALLRWPDSGITPDVFIPIAEKTGLICEITRWVVTEVARQMLEWRHQGIQVKVAINISTRDLLDKSIAAFIVDAFDSRKVDKSQVIIEVTESAVMKHATLAIERLSFLRDQGFGVAIDDFGTGYSSMAYLSDLPATELKIDRRFIGEILKSKRDKKLVKAMIALAHEFDLLVVAEGVEHQQQADLLKTFGCEMIQGYLFSQPVEADRLAYLLR
jgi:diguanylate cyclase (GGDEF)-like protein